MTGRKGTGAEFEQGAGGEALYLEPKQHAATPSARDNGTPALESAQPLTQLGAVCVTCGGAFTPNRQRFRKCLRCAVNFKAARVALVKKRMADGVTVYQLRQHLNVLGSHDAEASAWLARMKVQLGAA